MQKHFDHHLALSRSEQQAQLLMVMLPVPVTNVFVGL
jgi:hypothetical protein